MLEQGAHAGFVHFAAQEVVLRAHAAMWAVASPMPKPISRISGASRPGGGCASSGAAA
jgi:uncharacterized protein YfaT (DUF1175 family)